MVNRKHHEQAAFRKKKKKCKNINITIIENTEKVYHITMQIINSSDTP